MSTFDAAVTFLYTGDLDAAARFAEDDLGLPLVLDQGACRIYRVARSAYVGWCRRDDPSTGDVIVTLVTDDVDAMHERLVARGAAIEEPPTFNERFGIYHFFVRDPAGHRIEIQRFERGRADIT